MATNCRLKIYPKFAKLNVCFGDEIYGRPSVAFEERRKGVGDSELSLRKSKERARRSVIEICNLNPFEYMFTLTFSSEFVDRYDPKQIYNRLSNWLREHVRKSDFLYVAVPEYHKDGAIHLHGFCTLGDLELVPSRMPSGRLRKDRQGRQVFNCSDWRYGFSVFTPLDVDGADKAYLYATEYIMKGQSKIFGKWFLSARDCVKEPELIDLPSVSCRELLEVVRDETGVEVDFFEVAPYIYIWSSKLYYEGSKQGGKEVVLPCYGGGMYRLNGYYWCCNTATGMVY